jgi:competence ComEA-like helix-hairpin-helix protein
MTPVTSAASVDERSRAAHRAALGSAALMLLVFLFSGGLGRTSEPRHTPSPAEARLRLDPNVATREELMLLPGIGEKFSAEIVSYRQSAARQPAFASADDLDHVRGIGRARVEQLRPHLRFERQSPP